MRILAGGPTREMESEVFRLHREGLEAQDGSFELVVEHEVVEPTNDQNAEFDGGSSRWPADAVQRVAQCRQRFMDRVDPSKNRESRVEERFDALFMVDSDVVCGPGVLERLLAVDAPVVYGVFWTLWPRFEKPLPQVWDVHPYGYSAAPDGKGPSERIKPLFQDGVNEVEVLGGGACTLFRGRAFESRYWPLLDGLRSPGWYGEDRGYCLGLECRDIKQVAVTGLPIVHLYAPEQQTLEAVRQAREVVGL